MIQPWQVNCWINVDFTLLFFIENTAAVKLNTYTETKFKVTTFNFIFLTERLWYWNIFLPKYVHFNGLKLSGNLEKFCITSQFSGSKNAKIIFLKTIRVLGVFFLELKHRWFQTRLANLKNHQTPLHFCICTKFYDFFFFKKSLYSAFSIFSKIIKCTY